MSSADPEEVTAMNKMTTCVSTYTVMLEGMHH